MGASNVLITQGTQTAVATDTVGTVNYQVVKLDMGTLGISNAFGGTFPEVTNVANVAKGTISAGTMDTIGLTHANYFGTTVFTGTSTLGTIKAALGAGTRIYVTDLIISVGSASNIVIGDGAASTPLAGTFFFAANGGLTTNFRTPLRTSQGGTLVFQQSAAIGSCTITAFGYFAP